MASMLRDTHRNEMYQVAITEAVQRFRKAHGRSPVVLDIGCGTGLLVIHPIPASVPPSVFGFLDNAVLCVSSH
jgi:tRNA G46 methylase TrmB